MKLGARHFLAIAGPAKHVESSGLSVWAQSALLATGTMTGVGSRRVCRYVLIQYKNDTICTGPAT